MVFILKKLICENFFKIRNIPVLSIVSFIHGEMNFNELAETIHLLNRKFKRSKTPRDMQSINQLFKRFKQMKYSPVTGEIVFQPLANELNPDETILKLIEGAFQKTLGILLATDLRIFYIGINRFNKTTLEQIRYENIISVTISEPKIISAEVIIHSKNLAPIVVKGCDYNEARQFVELIKMLTAYNAVSQTQQ